MPPSKRIAISASVATRWTSSNVSSEASRSESSGSDGSDDEEQGGRRQPDSRGDDSDDDRDRQRAGDEQDQVAELEDVAHGGILHAVPAVRPLTDSLPVSHCSHMRQTDTGLRMRLAALTLLVLTLSAAAAAGAAKAPAGSLSIEGGRGVIQITGKGALLGKIERDRSRSST